MLNLKLSDFNQTYDFPTFVETYHSEYQPDMSENTLVLVNSYGGYADIALGAANKMALANATVLVTGTARSCGTLPSLLCAKSYALEGTTFMIHNPTFQVGGTAKEIQDAAASADTETLNFANLYFQKMSARRPEKWVGLGVEQVIDWFNESKVFTAEEAEEWGLISELAEIQISNQPAQNRLEAVMCAAINNKIFKMEKRSGLIAQLKSLISGSKMETEIPESEQLKDDATEFETVAVATISELKAKIQELEAENAKTKADFEAFSELTSTVANMQSEMKSMAVQMLGFSPSQKQANSAPVTEKQKDGKTSYSIILPNQN